jgi:hypothetical protein
MERQALQIQEWGANVNVKIPITNTAGKPAYDLIRKLTRAGVKLNITAIMTLDQVRETAACLEGGPASYVSVFAGRIADTGRDPLPIMAAAVEALRALPQAELIWASPRELLNIYHAESVGCQVITVTHDVLKKALLVGKDLSQYSLETVKMFYDDAQKAGFTLNIGASRNPGSLDDATRKNLKALAERRHGGNVSAFIAELATREIKLAAAEAFFERYGAPPLSDEAISRIEAEWRGEPNVVAEGRQTPKRKRQPRR